MRRIGSYCDGYVRCGRSRNAGLLLLLLATALVPLLAGCGSNQSTLRPASKASSDIATIWWVMLVGSAVVFAVVLALVVVVVVRRRGAATPADGPGARNRGAHIFIGVAGVLVPLVVLAALFALTLGTISTTSSAAGASSSVMTIQVTGRQWFWDVEYPDEHVRTANEIHIPVGETVTIVALSGDVIHSFWVPQLNRKIDMIPGQRNGSGCTLTVPASSAGSRRVCGLSTRTWCSPSSPNCVTGSTRGSPESRPPPAADARPAARTAGAARLGVRLLPYHRRHERERRDRP